MAFFPRRFLFLPFSLLAALPLWARGQAPETKFGHHRYAQAPASELRDVGPYRATGRVVRMRRQAAEAFLKMAAAARAGKISLIPVSGFRTIDYQEGLFDNAIRKQGSPQAAAKWVAPPGYSEHHTGWTLDLGDETAPSTDVEPSFDQTPAFSWLKSHAAQFGFELSFPKDNPQGVSYAPFHWRFVGVEESKKLFHK